MRVLTRVFLAFCLLSPLAAYPNDYLNQPYNISRAQWLEIAVERRVQSVSSLWKLSLSVQVSVNAKDNAVLVILSPSNGQLQVSSDVKDRYIGDITTIVQSVLNDFSWAADVTVRVLFV